MTSVNILLIILLNVSLYCCASIQELHKDLFERRNYSKWIAPTTDNIGPLKIFMTYDLVAISKFDAMAGKFVPRALLSFTWTDSLLSWDPLAYDGIVSFMYPIEKVWFPPVVSASSYNSSKVVCHTGSGTELRVMFTGTLQWLCGNQFEDTCSPDVEHFPFDRQRCDSAFTIWGYDKGQAVLVYDNTSLYANKHDNGQWERKRVSFRSGNIYGFSSLNVIVEFQRKALFMILVVIIPIFVFGFLNLLVFLIGPGSGEKLSYSMTVLLANALFLVIITETLPKVSRPIPNICIMVVSNFATSVVSCACSVFTVHLYYTESKPARSNTLLRRMSIYLMRKVRDVTECTETDTSFWQKTSIRIDSIFFVSFAFWILFTDVVFILSITPGTHTEI